MSAIAFIAILSSGLESESTRTDAANTTIDQPEARGERRRPARYVVQNGDTLIAISEKTGVSVSRLQELNPDVDPQILISGQRLKLR